MDKEEKELRARLAEIEAAKINEWVVKVPRFKAENILLTPIEKKKLFSDVFKLLLEDMNGKLNES